jgi:hypothetical protein
MTGHGSYPLYCDSDRLRGDLRGVFLKRHAPTMPFAREMAWSLPGGLIRQPWRFLTTTLTKVNILSESTKPVDANI